MLKIVFDFLQKFLTDYDVAGVKIFEGVTIQNRYIPGKTNDPENIGNKVFITLLSIEEERSAKTPYRYERNLGVNPNAFQLLNPVICLNLYVMFSGTGDYSEALKNISKVITVFANQSAFETADIDTNLPDEDVKGEITEISLDIQNISLDQSNNLWQALANNILPHIIYKIRTLAVVPNQVLQAKPEVTTIGVEVQNK